MILPSLCLGNSDTLNDMLLDELHLLLISDARDVTVSIKNRMKNISAMATTLLSDTLQTKNPTVAIPLLIYLARACAAINTPTAYSVSRRIKSIVYYTLSHPPSITTPAITALLNDPLANPPLVHQILEKYVSVCPPHELPLLLRAVLTNLTSATHLADVIVSILSRGPPGGELLLALEIALVERRSLCQPVLAAFGRLINTKEDPKRKVGGAVLAALLCFLRIGDDNTIQRIYQLLEQLLYSQCVQLDLSAVGSSSQADSEVVTQAVWTEAIRSAALNGSSERVVDFFESQMWKSKPKATQYAREMLYQIFVWCAQARVSILRATFAALTEKRTPPNVLVAFCMFLEQIVATPNSRYGLRHCKDILGNCLASLTIMYTDVACRIIGSMVTIFVSLPAFCDPLMVFLRKISSSRASKSLRLASAGLVALLQQSDVPDGLLAETCQLLSAVYQMCQRDDRSYVLQTLLKASESHHTPFSHLHPLSEWIFVKLTAIQTHPFRFNFSKCFHLVAGQYVCTDPFPLILRYCAGLRREHTKVDTFFSALCSYLGEENGAIADVCSPANSPVPVLERVKLLCQIMETCFALELPKITEKHMFIYAAGILIRDFLASKSTNEGNGSTTKKKDYSHTLQFATVVVRESESPNLVGTIFEMCEDMAVLRARACALEFIEKHSSLRNDLFAHLIRAEALGHLHLAVRNVFRQRPAQLDLQNTQRLLGITQSCFALASPWNSRQEGGHILAGDGISKTPKGKDDNVTTLTTSAVTSEQNSDDRCLQKSYSALEFWKSLSLHKEAGQALEPSYFKTLEDPKRIRVREVSLKIYEELVTNNAVEDEILLLLQLTGKEGKFCNERKTRKCSEAPSITSLVSNNEELEKAHVTGSKRLLAIERLTSLFKREFANSLSIGLTLSYLTLLARFLEKDGDDECYVSKRIKEAISTTLMDLLRNYSIRHISVVRALLPILLKSISKESGLDFANSVLMWLGNDPCLLNSRFVIEDDEIPTKLGVNEFDIEILQEAMALDNGAQYDADQDPIAVKNNRPAHRCRTTAPPISSDASESETMELESSPQLMTENNAVEALCLNETPEIAILAISRVVEFCECHLQSELQAHRQAMKTSTLPADRDRLKQDLSTSKVIEAITGFFETEFITSVSPGDCKIPLYLLRKIASILHILMEIAELNMNLMFKMLEKGWNRQDLSPMAVSTTKIFNLVYDSCSTQALIRAIIDIDGCTKRHSLQERIGVAAAAFLQAARRKKLRESGEDDELTVFIDQLRTHSQKSFQIQSFKSAKSDEEELANVFRVSRPRKRQRLRSRNPHIDHYLDDWAGDERNDDNYADLEDFIAQMDEDL